MKQFLPLFKKTPAYVVGGAVRDRMLSITTDDIDIVIEKDPTSLANKIAALSKGSAFPLDKERGIMRVALPDHSHIDIARWQGKNLEADLDRRDFTINAMAVPLEDWIKPSWKKSVIDRHNGLRDLTKRQIISVAPTIFKEDPLRLLRAFRIAGELNFGIPPVTLTHISKFRTLIKKPAPERKREEMLRLFAAPDSYSVLVLMDKSGLLDEIFPEAKALRKTAPVYYGKGGVLKHTLSSVKCFEDVLRDKTWFPGMNEKIKTYLDEKFGGHSRRAHCKWGLMLHDIGKPATMKVIDGRVRFFEHEHVGAEKIPALAKKFRWSSDESSRYANYVRHHMRPGNLATHGDVSDKAIYRFFRDLGDEAIAMLLISLGDHLTYLSPAQRRKRNSSHERVTIKMVRQFYTRREKVLPAKVLNGNDIMRAFHLKPSPLIGALLSDLQEAQSEQKISNKQQALSYLKTRIDEHKEKFAAAPR